MTTLTTTTTSTTTPTSAESQVGNSPRRIRIHISRTPRLAILTTHVAAAVALLGVSAAVVAVGVLAGEMDDPSQVRTAGEIMETFAMTFGIPLSMVTLATGLALGWSSRWGVLRHGWVMAKLVLLMAVMTNGALLLGSAESVAADTGEIPDRLVPAAIFNVAALLLATGLSVFKPVAGRSRARRSLAR